MGHIYTVSKEANYFPIISCGLKKNASNAPISEILYNWPKGLFGFFHRL